MTIQLIELTQDEPGFGQFIGSWLVTGPLNFLVDVGPANTAGRLAAALDALGVDRIDYILITHIHIDHAGALADMLARYPMAMAVCHEKAIPLITDPSKLWAGSLSVLKKTAEMYGAPKPVAIEKLIPHTQCRIPGLAIIETPGHAAHHLCYAREGRLFAGEAAGNWFPVGDSLYLRPATPPRFFMTIFLESLARLRALPPHVMCYAHFGEAANSHGMLDRFRDQLLRWEEILRRELETGEPPSTQELLNTLLAKDPELAMVSAFPPDVRKREMGFLTNSVNGFIGFLTDSKQA